MDRQKTRLAVKVSLVFTIYMKTKTSKTFYSSTNETNGLLASLTTITESLNSIRSLINTRPKSKTFYSSISDKNCTADFITRKIETLGSIFSNETRFCEAACVFYYYDRKSIFYTLPHKYTSNKLDFL